MFSCEIHEISKNIFFMEHHRWLLLYSHYGAIKTVTVKRPSHRLLQTMFTLLINRNLNRFFVEKQHLSLSFMTLNFSKVNNSNNIYNICL